MLLFRGATKGKGSTDDLVRRFLISRPDYFAQQLKNVTKVSRSDGCWRRRQRRSDFVLPVTMSKYFLGVNEMTINLGIQNFDKPRSVLTPRAVEI